MKKLLLVALFLLAAPRIWAQKPITAAEAAKLVGQKVTIYDALFGGRYFEQNNLLLINVGSAFPGSPLTLVAKGEDCKKFSTDPQAAYAGKKAYITGTVELYHGKPEIVLTDSTQLKIDAVK